ncbi:MAG TPA: ComEA family DNA-binding protein [Gemmatimonadaceae bacterium]
MSTPTERKALLFLGVVACLGGGVRVLRAREIQPPPASARRDLDAQIQVVDSTRRMMGGAPRHPAPPRRDSGVVLTVRGAFGRGRGRGLGRVASPQLPAQPPPSSIHRLDVDQASAVELQALPGVGPAMAARIVAYRDSNGPFGSMDRLRRVKGIGPATSARLDSLVPFSGTPRP